MGKTKPVSVKSAKSRLKGNISKRKSFKRSAAITPKLKKLSLAQAKEELIPKQLEFSELLNLTESENESEDVQTLGPFVKAPDNSINLEQIENGVKALFEYIEKISDNKTELFPDEQPIFLQIAAIKVPKTPNRQLRLTLKHSLLPESSEICLIVKDVGRPKEHDETIEHYEKLLKEKGITNIKTIMPYNQFKNEYGNQFELKRKLLGLYDYFLVDGKISGYVVNQLGKIFLEKRKMPTPVKMDATNLKDHFETSLKKTLMKLHSKSDAYAVQVAHTKMSRTEVFENISTIIDELARDFPGSFDNIRSLGLKTDKSIIVPIYLSLKNKSTVKVPVVTPKRPRQFKNVTGELTTFLDKDVTVLPTGEIIVSNQGLEDGEFPIESDYEDEEEKEEDRGGETFTINDEEVNDEIVEEDSREVKESGKEELPEDGEEENGILDQAEELYLNQYEQEHVTTRKTRKTNKKSEDEEIPVKRNQKRAKGEKENYNVKEVSKKVINKKKQETTKQKKVTKTKKQANSAQNNDEDILAQAEEVYLDQNQQKQTVTKTTRKAKVNKTKSEKKEIPLKKAKKIKDAEIKNETSNVPAKKNAKGSKTTTSKKSKKETTPSISDQPEISKPKKAKTKKQKIPEKTNEGIEVQAENVQVNTRKPRKTKAEAVDVEIPIKKSKTTANQPSENKKEKKNTGKSKVLAAVDNTKDKIVEPSKKVVEKGKKKATKTTKTKEIKTSDEIPERVTRKVDRATVPVTKTEKAPTLSKRSRKVNKAVDQEKSEDTESKTGKKEKKIKSPTFKAKAKKGKKGSPKTNVLKLKLKAKNVDKN